MSKWRSFADWSGKPLFLSSEISTDDHPTREQAQAVADMLMRDGLGGQRVVFPNRTWVEEIVEKGETK